MTRPCPLRSGAHLQPYLQAHGMPDLHEHRATYFAALDGILAEWADVGGVGFVVHSFVGAMTPALFGEHAALGAKHGLQTSCAWGLGQHDSLLPEAAARWIAAVAKHPACAATALDAETAWRNEPGDVDAARRLGAELRRLAPAAYFVGQFAAVLQTADPEYRRMGRKEFLAFVDALASMDYANYAPFSPHRYDVFAKWRAKHATLGADLGVPQSWTTLATYQGYWWKGIVHDCVDCLMTTPGDVALVWAEPRPDADFLAAMRAVKASGGDHVAALRALEVQGIAVPDSTLALASKGYVGPGAAARFQSDHGLKSDGVIGPKTRASLGL